MLDTCIGMKQLFGYQQQSLKDPLLELCLLRISGNPAMKRIFLKEASESSGIYKMQIRSDEESQNRYGCQEAKRQP